MIDFQISALINTVINTLHIILVVSFVAVTGVLLAMTTVQRIRIRGIRMTWFSARLGSLPVWPTLFMGLVVVFMLYSSNTVTPVSGEVFAGYFLGGMLWFAAVALSGSVIVTEYGIIPEAGRSSEAVGWGQVFDWFEQEDEKRSQVTFLYQDLIGERKRLDVIVPRPHMEQFRRMVRTKLDGPSEVPTHAVRHGQALNN